MNICVTYWGGGSYLTLLNKWLAHYRKSGCQLPVTILTDLTSPIPEEARGYWSSTYHPVSFLRFDPKALPLIIRSGNGFDVKGSLICQALQTVGRCLIVDIDAFFVKNPMDLIEDLPLEATIGMGADPSTRLIKGVDFELVEKNAGVLYFGVTNSETRSDILNLYACLFNTLKTDNPGPLLEQIVWTVLHARMPGSCDLPKQLNWSRRWMENINEAVILHEHGDRKWLHVDDMGSIGKLKFNILKNDLENAAP